MTVSTAGKEEEINGHAVGCNRDGSDKKDKNKIRR